MAISKVNQLNPDFVITGGDLIMDALNVTTGKAEELYTLYLNTMKNFTMPVYNSIGNHEVFGLFDQSGISPDHPEYGKKMYLHRLDLERTFHSFDHKGWHFIILDAIGFTDDRKYIGEIDSLQMVWLKNDLKNVEKNTPISLSLHIPLVSIRAQMINGGTEALSAGSVVNNNIEVINAFKSHNLKMVLQGHLHIVEEIIYKDVHYITGGAVCGAWWKGPRDGFPEGFVMVEVKENAEFNWRYETFGWQPVRE